MLSTIDFIESNIFSTYKIIALFILAESSPQLDIPIKPIVFFIAIASSYSKYERITFNGLSFDFSS